MLITALGSVKQAVQIQLFVIHFYINVYKFVAVLSSHRTDFVFQSATKTTMVILLQELANRIVLHLDISLHKILQGCV